MSSEKKSYENPAETMRKVMEEYTAPIGVSPDGKFDPTFAYLVSSPGYRNTEDLTHKVREAAQYLKPLKRTGTARLDDLQSLIDWTNRHKGENSVMFTNGSAETPSITTIADYNLAGAASIDPKNGDPLARHGEHRAIYNFPLSDEWKAWTRIAGKALEKDDIGEFLEEHIAELMEVTPAIIKGQITDENQPWENRLIEVAQKIEGRFGQPHEVLQLTKKFQVFETSDLKVATNRDTGEAEVVFTNEHKDATGQKLVIPNLLIIAIPVFRNGAPYRMAVRFRYRKAGGAVAFILSPYNQDKVFKDAIDLAAKQAKEATELPMFYGTPERG